MCPEPIKICLPFWNALSTLVSVSHPLRFQWTEKWSDQFTASQRRTLSFLNVFYTRFQFPCFLNSLSAFHSFFFPKKNNWKKKQNKMWVVEIRSSWRNKFNGFSGIPRGGSVRKFLKVFLGWCNSLEVTTLPKMRNTKFWIYEGINREYSWRFLWQTQRICRNAPITQQSYHSNQSHSTK